MTDLAHLPVWGLNIKTNQTPVTDFSTRSQYKPDIVNLTYTLPDPLQNVPKDFNDPVELLITRRPSTDVTVYTDYNQSTSSLIASGQNWTEQQFENTTRPWLRIPDTLFNIVPTN